MPIEIHPTMRCIIANIKSIRNQKEYSQDYLAAKLHITQNAYSKMELGKTQLSISAVYKIADILEVEVRQLLDTSSCDKN
ncbi:MAG: helix-turn-helix transcriptional regulator [Bacteroidota bacterium]